MTPPLPESHDSRVAFNSCREVVEHQRDQGACASCWAQAGAHALETRICIETEGAVRTWLSSQYMTACHSKKSWEILTWFGTQAGNGCKGGWAENVWVGARKGIPSGSSNPSVGDTCVPYHLNGNALEHFDPASQEETPSCMRECTSNRFGKTLVEDMYKPRLSYTMFGDLQKARRAMVDGGMVVLSYDVYRDFMAYARGLYVPESLDSGSKSGRHAVSCFGYGPAFLKCKNSWGRKWGDDGNFMINISAAGDLGFFFKAITKLSIDSSSYPGKNI